MTLTPGYPTSRRLNRRQTSDRPTPGVLVVDDDIDFAASLATLLRLEGYIVAEAHDAATALRCLAEAAISVALVDVRLGNSNGVSLVRELQRRHPNVVCVMVTAFASIETAVEALQAGAYDYLCKPFYSEDLLTTLERCFERLELIESKRRAGEHIAQMKRTEAIGQMASGIAHDFNNILAVQYSTLAWLRSRLGDRRDLLEAVEDAIGALEDGRELISRLLGFGRGTGAAGDVLDLRGELPPMMRVLRHAVGDGINITIETGREVAPVRIGRGALESCLLNLALNARDAMPAGGTLRFEAHNISAEQPLPDHTGTPAPEGFVRLSVIDTGHGMPPEVCERALEPFFTTKPRRQGNGLGLSTVESAIRRAGGSVSIISAVGQGTRVDLYLPPAGTPATQSVASATNT